MLIDSLGLPYDVVSSIYEAFSSCCIYPQPTFDIPCEVSYFLSSVLAESSSRPFRSPSFWESESRRIRGPALVRGSM
jgi:hypothetical protein